MADIKAASTNEPLPAADTVSVPAQEPETRDPDAEQRILQAIAEAGSKNTDLLSELAATSDAPGQLLNNYKRADFLREQVKAKRAEAGATAQASDSQRKRHKSLRDSFARKIAYKVFSRKQQFDEKASTQEAAYHDSLERRHRAENELAGLEADEEALSAETSALLQLAKRHGKAHKEIDQLYASLFDGYTPGFPHEDEQEAKFGHAKASHAKTTDQLKTITGSVKAALTVKVAIEKAIQEQKRAAAEARSRLFSQHYVRLLLDRCAIYAQRGLELSQVAAAGVPASLYTEDISDARLSLDQCLLSVQEVADGLGTRQIPVAEPAIELVGAALTKALHEHAAFMDVFKSVSEGGRGAIRTTARSLENERQGLQQTRQGLFETTLGFGAAAPAYHECCDRTERFENDSSTQCANVEGPVVEEMPELAPPPPDYREVTDQ